MLRLLCLIPLVVAALSATELRAQGSAMPSFLPSVGNLYIAGGVGYGGVSGRAFSLTDGFACPAQSQSGALPVLVGGANGCATSASGFGFTMHGLIGYTMPGWIGVSGIELRGRIGQEVVEGALGGSVALSPAVTSSAFGTYGTTINGGLALSGRLGANIGGFIPFARAGVGLVNLSESLGFDATKARACLTCATGGTISWSRSTWSPSLVAGLGLEVPVGNFFLRAEGEVEAIFHPGAGSALMTAQSGGNSVAVGQAAMAKDSWLFARRVMISGGMRF